MPSPGLVGGSDNRVSYLFLPEVELLQHRLKTADLDWQWVTGSVDEFLQNMYIPIN